MRLGVKVGVFVMLCCAVASTYHLTLLWRCWWPCAVLRLRRACEKERQSSAWAHGEGEAQAVRVRVFVSFAWGFFCSCLGSFHLGLVRVVVALQCQHRCQLQQLPSARPNSQGALFFWGGGVIYM